VDLKLGQRFDPRDATGSDRKRISEVGKLWIRKVVTEKAPERGEGRGKLPLLIDSLFEDDMVGSGYGLGRSDRNLATNG
jgi:hypothetical protein